jgi:hypothetical protein
MTQEVKISLTDLIEYVQVLLAKLTIAKPVNKFPASHVTLPLVPVMERISLVSLLRLNRPFQNVDVCPTNRISRRKPAFLQLSCFSSVTWTNRSNWISNWQCIASFQKTSHLFSTFVPTFHATESAVLVVKRGESDPISVHFSKA